MKKTVLMAWVAAGVVLAAGVVGWGLRDRRPVLVCLGDSLTACGGQGGHYSDWLAKFMPYVRVIDAGIGGDTLEGGRARFSHSVLRHRPDVVLIALGANDFWQHARSVEALRGDLDAMVREAQDKKCQVIVASCFGDRAFWEEPCTEFEFGRYAFAWEIGRMERALCAERRCIYVPNMQVDIKPNRLPPYWDETDHPNRAGNEQVALRLMPAVRRALASVKKR
jgi:lysophospholipase L1-like esterase